MTAVESRAPEVRTAAGRVRGRHEDGVTVFRGIPFAEPPVGDARFAAPRPARAWDGVREVFSFGPPPPQDLGGFRERIRPADGNEWLTVNVWTPDAEPGARRPVMVWIQGGAYKFGSADNPGYDARRIVRDGAVVVVTFNYRLGIEGFAAIEGAPANRGLLDQVAALEWVQDNIGAFGGDPGNVTVFGQSAGGGSIAALLAMPRAAGLFRRAIAQSVPGTFLSAELAADVAAAIAAELGMRPTTADLSTVVPRELALAGEALGAKMREHAGRWGLLAQGRSPFAPVVDGEVLSTTPWQALAAGAGRDVPLVTGHTRDECRLFLAQGEIADDQVAAALRAYAPAPDGDRVYRESFPDATTEWLFERVQTDWLFVMPTLRLAEAHAAGGGPTYLYELTWPAPGSGGIFGACHTLDLPLLFGTPHPILIGPEPAPEARALASRMRSAWTAFARTGDPGWPTFDPERRRTQVFDVEPALTAYPEETSRRIWQDHTFSALPLL
jgi:para-nitrobenzyl esterase